MAQQEAEEEYRAERKASRGRVVGGGFGVGGAIKGMATAETMNIISGAGHSLVNAIGNAGSALEAASAKRALYNNSSTKSLLRKAIRSDIISCVNAHINLVNERKGKYYISCFDSDKAGALLGNAKKVDDDRRVELLIESFNNCPWNEDLLVYIFTSYKEERRNVWSIAKRFYVDLYQTAENVFAGLYTDSAKNSEEKAKEVKKDILEQMSMLGITVSGTVDKIERDCIERILKYYHTANEAKRQELCASVVAYDAADRNKTFVIHKEGIWELAKKYNVSFTTDETEEILKKYYKARKGSSNFIDVAQDDKEKIKIVMKALGVTQSVTFDMLESDCLSCLCGDFQSSDEATCNALIEKVKVFDALEKNKKPFLHKLQLRIESIWSAEDGEIFDNVFLNTDIHKQEEINKSLEFIKSKKRTSDAGKYISALTGCSPENIKKVHQFQQPLTKATLYVGIALIVLGIIFLVADLGFVLSVAIAAVGVVMLVYYNKLKKVWDKLTLKGTLVHPMLSITGQAQHNPIVKTEEEQTAELEEKAKLRMEIEEYINKTEKGESNE